LTGESSLNYALKHKKVRSFRILLNHPTTDLSQTDEIGVTILGAVYLMQEQKRGNNRNEGESDSNEPDDSEYTEVI
jgi:hypothetical protein